MRDPKLWKTAPQNAAPRYPACQPEEETSSLNLLGVIPVFFLKVLMKFAEEQKAHENAMLSTESAVEDSILLASSSLTLIRYSWGE